jgi:hypothetical protein
LIARAFLDPEAGNDRAKEATDLASGLGDEELRSWAWGARVETAMARGGYEEAYTWARRRFDLVPTLDDPDHIALIYVFGQPSCVATARFTEANDVAVAHDQVTATLTPHHRMHAAMLHADVQQAMGRWTAVRDLTERIEAAVEANVATPCSANVGALLICALANVHLGDDTEARRLERAAEGLGMEGYTWAPRYVEIATAREDRDALEALLGSWEPEGLSDYDGVIAWSNALVALDRRAEIEEKTPTFMNPGTYVEPFLLRALGAAREDQALIGRAADLFDGMDLSWHAAETKRLAAQR